MVFLKTMHERADCTHSTVVSPQCAVGTQNFDSKSARRRVVTISHTVHVHYNKGLPLPLTSDECQDVVLIFQSIHV